MPDREQVIDGLERCLKGWNENGEDVCFPCDSCPYYSKCHKSPVKDIATDLMRDALALLKEQQETIERQRLIILEQKR